jgi:hypothetical protein
VGGAGAGVGAATAAQPRVKGSPQWGIHPARGYNAQISRYGALVRDVGFSPRIATRDACVL